MPALVSVVIPCYAQAHFLADAIESVQAQTHPHRELVVVDDGSPDDVRAVTARYPRIGYLRQANQGIGAARNAGLARVTGEYVVFLDADDRLLPNALTAGVTALEAHPLCAFVWGYNRPIDAQGQLLPFPRCEYRGGTSYRELLQQNIVGPPVGVMFRRTAVEEVGRFSTQVRGVEDYELYLRLARRYPYFCHQQVIAEYRYHGANMSSDSAFMLKALLLILRAQEPWVAGDRELVRALQRGKQDAWYQYDAEPRLEQLRGFVRGRQWRAATACGARLLARYPGVFLQVAARYARRSLIPSRAT